MNRFAFVKKLESVVHCEMLRLYKGLSLLKLFFRGLNQDLSLHYATDCDSDLSNYVNRLFFLAFRIEKSIQRTSKV